MTLVYSPAIWLVVVLAPILNRTEQENIKAVGEKLSSLKPMLYGFEVDSGKNDMASGKLWINFAWSGDAVYAMDIAEEMPQDKLLDYADEMQLELMTDDDGSIIIMDDKDLTMFVNLLNEDYYIQYDYAVHLDNLVSNHHPLLYNFIHFLYILYHIFIKKSNNR